VRRLFNEAEKAMGGLDIVVANAGVHIVKPLIENTEADYDYIFDINTRGVFFTLQEAGRRVRDGGRIVVVSTGGTKMHFANMSLYLGSKGAIEQFARSLALELGPRNVTVNILSPGFTDTDMLPDSIENTARVCRPLIASALRKISPRWPNFSPVTPPVGSPDRTCKRAAGWCENSVVVNRPSCLKPIPLKHERSRVRISGWPIT
jgi:NAD(P)-dependent dehydrogenase (short-subunit alcohol dehydrogenase family)